MSLSIDQLEALIGKQVHCVAPYSDPKQVYTLIKVERRTEAAKIQGLHAPRGYCVCGSSIREIEP